MKKLPDFLFVATIIFAVGFGGWLLHRGNGSDDTQEETRPHLLSWQTGVAQQYRVSMNSSVNLNSAAAGAKQKMDVRFKARLNLLTLAATTEHALAGIQLSNVLLNVSGHSDPEMNSLLEKPFRVRYSSGGVPEKFEFPKGLTEQEQSILKNVVMTFTVSDQGDDIHAQEWASNEESASGMYEAMYQRVSPTRLNKSKRNFVAATSNPLLKGATIQSQETIDFNTQNNWITRMVVEETLHSANQHNTGVQVDNYSSIELSQSTGITLSKKLWQFKASAPIANVNPAKSPATQLSAAQAQKQLIAEIPRLDVANQNRTQHIHTLRDLLRMNGTMPSQLLEQMDSQDISDRTRADLYLALELAATPEAQTALTSVMINPDKAGRDALRATVALAGINNPSPETLATLWETAESDRSQLSNTATYTLGSIGSRMKVGAHPDYPQLRDELLASAYGHSEASDRATYLYALGNTRDADLASDVSYFLDDQQPTVRRAAASALGLMPSTSSSSALIKRFKQESQSDVRASIAESLSHIPVSDSAGAMVAISQAIQQESNESARYSMANFMGKHLAQHPQYKPLLQSLLRTEPSKRVRHVMGEALASL